ncbi:MAG TPA: DUF4349 domain-containing protein [Candidatus Dormibacteraeota bacterium]|nr:DUF4349 domain-containing protein [Candidatus Dormibacteraeota bacterium]
MKKLLVAAVILVAAYACGQSAASSAPAHQPLALSNGTAQQAPDKSTATTTTPGSISYVPSQPVPNPIQGPLVIRQAQLTVSVTSGSFDSKLADVRRLVELEDGFIAGTDAQVNPQTADDRIRTGVISFMVPAKNFDDTIDGLAKLGKVQNEHISGQDVSSQYVDLQARLANAEAQRNAMLALLQQAHSVPDIIAIQNQLGQITQQIEELKGQIQYLDHNTSFSTVTVSIVEAGAPAPVQSTDNWGFVTALSDAAHNFVTTINYIITGLGAIGPVLLLLALAYFVWRRLGSPTWRRA